MKVLLINPPFLKGFKEFNLNLPPIGLGYIAAVLEKEGHNVKILDLSVEQWNDNGLSSYDAVGITSLTPTYPEALKVARRIRDNEPDIPLIIGGPHASFLDDNAFDVFDFAVRGEGEYTFSELIDVLENGQNFSEIKGLTYSTNGEVKRNQGRFFIKDLDILPFPARHLFNLKAKGYMKMDGEVVASAVSSRGCPFGCSFCSASRLNGLQWRARSPGNVAEEIEEIRFKYGYKALSFVDDNFSLDPKRVEGICNEIKERGVDIKWGCMSRVDTIIKNPWMVEDMAEAGCTAVYMGIESANEEVLESYNKRTNVEMIKKAFEILKDNGMGIIGSFIIGEFKETRNMIENTIKFAKALNPDVAQFSILTPLPGTELWDKVHNRIIRKNLEFLDGTHGVMNTEYLKPEELEDLLVKAYTQFYLRPGRILNEIKYIIKTGDISELGQIWRFIRARKFLF